MSLVGWTRRCVSIAVVGALAVPFGSCSNGSAAKAFPTCRSHFAQYARVDATMLNARCTVDGSTTIVPYQTLKCPHIENRSDPHSPMPGGEIAWNQYGWGWLHPAFGTAAVWNPGRSPGGCVHS